MRVVHKIFIILLTICVIFFIFNYKKIFYGNNISIKNKDEIIEKILNGKIEYKANIKVNIISNKNQNIYEIMQEESQSQSYQKITSDGDINGVEIIYTDNVLKVENSRLNLKKIYENYELVTSDYLFLSSFSKDYLESQDTSLEKIDNTIVISLKVENSNKYIKYKELYVNRDTGIPIKMIIKNSDKQVIACIEYINIEIL